MLCCSRGAMPCLDHASLITAIGHLLARQASPRAPRGPEPTEFGMAREARMPCNRLAPHAKKHFGWYRRPAPVQRPARRHPCGCTACGCEPARRPLKSPVSRIFPGTPVSRISVEASVARCFLKFVSALRQPRLPGATSIRRAASNSGRPLLLRLAAGSS
jgi:hypothetical protein